MQPIATHLLERVEKHLRTDIRYLIKGGGWLSGGQGVSTLLSLAVAVAFANLLPKEDYGTYKYILSIATILAIPALPGMVTPIVQTIARGNDGAYLSGFKAKLRWGILGAIGSALLGIYYILFEHNAIIGTAFILLSPFIPLMEALGLWSVVYNGKKLFREAVLRNTFVQAVTSIITIISLLITKNIVVILFVYAASYSMVRYLMHKMVLRKFPSTNHASDPEHSVEFGKRLSILGIFSTLVDQIDQILIFHFFGATMLAGYAFAIATTTPAKGLMKSVLNLAYPKFSEKSSHLLKKTISHKVWKSFLLFLPLTIIYIAALPYLYKIFFPKYIDSVLYAQALGLIFLFFPGKLYSIAVTTRLDRRPTYILNTLNPIINSVILLVLLATIGVWGAIAAHILEYVTSLALTYYYFRKMKD